MKQLWPHVLVLVVVAFIFMLILTVGAVDFTKIFGVDLAVP